MLRHCQVLTQGRTSHETWFQAVGKNTGLLVPWMAYPGCLLLCKVKGVPIRLTLLLTIAIG